MSGSLEAMDEKNCWPRLTKAPIVEAIFDIQTVADPGMASERLASIAPPSSDEYPIVQVRESIRSDLRFNPDGSVDASNSHRGRDGRLFRSRDGRQAVQFNLNGFSFNRLKPYDTWDSFFATAWMHWERYRDAARPASVSRVGVRYINRLPLPLPFNDFKDYVRTTPEIAPDLPQALASFLMRLVIPDEAHEALVVLTETFEAQDNGVLPFILDIDVFRAGVWVPDDPALPGVFEMLREVKNNFFFNSLTERAKELFR